MNVFQIGCEAIKNEKISKTEKEEKGCAISIQRAFLVFHLLAFSFKDYILEAFERKPPLSLEEKLRLLLPHLRDPNKKRKNSMQLLLTLLL